MDLYKQLIKQKTKVLSEKTYTGLVELFMSNGFLDYASYFLCQMDKQKMKIPRNLLDLFLEYSVKNKIFERAEKEDFAIKQFENDKKNNNTDNYNKYDQYDPQNDPDYAYYFTKRNLYKKRKDMKSLFSSLKVESKPFFPKCMETENNNFDKIKMKLNDIDPTKVKEFIPKSYKIGKKN